jgi:hypothetical protein
VAEDLAAIAAFTEARLTEWEAWALAASKPYKYADGDPPVPPGGVHWQWGAGENWEPAEPDLSKEIVGDWGQHVQLVTVEEWPAQHGQWSMNRPYSDHVCEMDSAAAGHIIRHDPATVLRDIAAKRRLLNAAIMAWNESCNPVDEFWVGIAPTLITLVRNFAAVWEDHPDYRKEWAA